MHCMYTAQKQNVQKIISLRILVVSRVKCVEFEAHNIKKKYRLLSGRKHFRLQMICKRPSITRHDNIFGVLTGHQSVCDTGYHASVI